jgi:hypothetical protein
VLAARRFRAILAVRRRAFRHNDAGLQIAADRHDGLICLDFPSPVLMQRVRPRLSSARMDPRVRGSVAKRVQGKCLGCGDIVTLDALSQSQECFRKHAFRAAGKAACLPYIAFRWLWPVRPGTRRGADALLEIGMRYIEGAPH